MAAAGASGPVSDGQGVIASKVDRASSAQGPGADMGLYAATPDAIGASAMSAGTALIPAIAWSHDVSEGLARSYAAEGTAVPLMADYAQGFSSETLPAPVAPDPSSVSKAPSAGADAAATTQPPVGSGSPSGNTGHSPAEHLYLQMRANEMHADIDAARGSGSVTSIGSNSHHTSLEAPLLEFVTEKAALVSLEANAVLTTLQATTLALGDILAQEAPALGQTIDILESQLEDLPQAADTLLAAVSNEVQSGLSQVVEASFTASSAVAEQVADVGAAATSALADTAGVISGQLITDMAGSLVQPLPDTLADLAGSDPAGGISTLVGLVSAADAFGVSDEGPSDIGLTDSLGTSGMLDLLAPPVIEPVVLGGDHPLDHTLSHLGDHHLGLG